MAGSRSDVRRFWLDPIFLGLGTGAWVGAAAALFLFHLVDFAAVPADRVVLTCWLVGHFAVAGGLSAALVTAGFAVFRGRDRAQEED